MKFVIYLVPVSFTIKGLPLDYQVVYRKLDDRTKFSRIHRKHILSAYDLLCLDLSSGVKLFRCSDGFINRILPLTGEDAYNFYKQLRSIGYDQE